MSEQVRIVYQDDSIVVLNKAPGVPSQPDPSCDPSALDLASELIGRPLHPVHRIDRPASGLLLLAVTSDAAAILSRRLQTGEIERRYWAIVAGSVDPPSGRAQDSLGVDRRSNKSRVSPGGKKAVLSYRTRAVGDRYTLLEVVLETGRHHQIRAQLAARGWPIRGDLKYGARRSQPGGGISLHAVSLGLPHPETGATMRFVGPPPEDRLWSALAAQLTPGE